jgi:hypothetical protein
VAVFVYEIVEKLGELVTPLVLGEKLDIGLDAGIRMVCDLCNGGRAC